MLRSDPRFESCIRRFQDHLEYLQLNADWVALENGLTDSLIESQDLAFPLLKQLMIDLCQWSKGKSLVRFITQSCPRLERFDVCYHDYDSALYEPIDWNALCTNMPNLTKLNLFGTASEFVSSIDNFLCNLSYPVTQRIQSLSIDCGGQLRAASCCNLNRFESLRELVLEYNVSNRMNKDQAEQKQEKVHLLLDALSGHSCLDFLHIHLNKRLRLSDEMIESIQKMNKLRILSINISSKQSDIPSTLSTLNQIEELRILSRRRFPNDLVNLLPKRNLKELMLLSDLLSDQRDTVDPVIGSILHAARVDNLFPRLLYVLDDKNHVFYVR